VLAPHTKIPPHSGVANTRLVAHLPLIVPPDCGFRCGATTVTWEIGKPFVFDDTIEHEAWNNSDKLRVVLIFDLWVPQLSVRERAAISRIMPEAGTTSAGI
jgi:aspartyl/asparaginyl beta-hydroxylase (cupin superfamily)